jgi:cytoskeletal protein CcmA (bactofilin family)
VETDSKLLNRRFSDTDPPATVIAAGTTVRGDLSGGDAVEIRGTLEGDCRVGAHCRVTEGARVRGSVEASGLVVAGEIEAETLTADTIEIRASARVRASLRARVVAIAEGAFYEGDVQMQGPDPSGSPVFFKDRRGPSDAGPSRA